MFEISASILTQQLNTLPKMVGEKSQPLKVEFKKNMGNQSQYSQISEEVWVWT